MPNLGECRSHIRLLHHMDEAECRLRLARLSQWPRKLKARIDDRAVGLIRDMRAEGPGEIEAFLLEYGLAGADGRALMGLAEALLRIPDAATRDALIADKLEQGDWAGHRAHSPSSLVNLSTLGLTLAGRGADLPLARWPIRTAMTAAISHLGGIFVMGESMDKALSRAAKPDLAVYRHSFDVLGEEARTKAQAERYLAAYLDAIAQVGAAAKGAGPEAGPGVSVKLSALHPRYEYLQKQRVMAELLPDLRRLCLAAKAVNIGLTIDAEEADRLELSLDVLEALMADASLAGWDGLGLALQAYQKRAVAVADWAVAAARHFDRRLIVRLVKGAYWDSEIKRAQERGLAGYPVFTTKAATDLSYLVCARILLEAPERIYAAFASHNAITVAAMAELAGPGRADWEYQRLHGMGTGLYGRVIADHPCRVYAPVGRYRQLLPYLVRRLLENGASTSFVHLLADETVAPETFVNREVDIAPLPPPPAIFLPQRRKAVSGDLCDGETLSSLQQQVSACCWRDISVPTGDPAVVVNRLVDGFSAWDRLGGPARAETLDRAADLLQADPAPFLALLMGEAGKTWGDAIAEIGEAVDFLRFYAAEARRLFGPVRLPAISGETNFLELRGRGVFACISPWNFPLAIFIGQVAAALAAGNCVAVKPAAQTPRIAVRATALLHQAGIPASVLALVVGDAAMGAALVAQPGLAGVAFTGSQASARAIAGILAAKDGPLVPLIAETGGVNAMIVDSSALTEQVAADMVASGFLSAGQRCSALRLAFIQDDMADALLEVLAGMVGLLKLGDPFDPATDMGPLIDAQAHQRLRAQEQDVAAHGRLLFRGSAPAEGNFMAPCAYEVDFDHLPKQEIFGPLVQVCRWRPSDFDRIMAWLASNGHGLTLGVHSRIDAFVQRITRTARIGNIYVNRGMTGAMVGCQPFGGMGLSGTGPKSGGPHTLVHYATEIVVTENVSAMGGNFSLLCRGQ